MIKITEVEISYYIEHRLYERTECICSSISYKYTMCVICIKYLVNSDFDDYTDFFY